MLTSFLASSLAIYLQYAYKFISKFFLEYVYNTLTSLHVTYLQYLCKIPTSASNSPRGNTTAVMNGNLHLSIMLWSDIMILWYYDIVILWYYCDIVLYDIVISTWYGHQWRPSGKAHVSQRSSGRIEPPSRACSPCQPRACSPCQPRACSPYQPLMLEYLCRNQK